MTGITINGIDTLERWGMMLLADLKIGVPALKENFVSIPGADGDINLSYALTDGEPTYTRREIIFSLFKSVDDNELAIIHRELLAECHGREGTLKTPLDGSHFYKGVFSVGDIKGYNSGRISVKMRAEPYALKDEETEVTIEIPYSGSTTVSLENEGRRVVPTFTVAGETTVTFNGNAYTIGSGTSQIAGVNLRRGSNEITLSGAAYSTVTIKYQEAKL